MKIYSLADVTLTGSKQRLSATSQPCKWFQVSAVSVGAAAARIGDYDNVGAARGVPIASGAGQFSPPFPGPLIGENYDLYDVGIIGTLNDTVAVIYAL